jgi:hypothetical protein
VSGGLEFESRLEHGCFSTFCIDIDYPTRRHNISYFFDLSTFKSPALSAFFLFLIALFRPLSLSRFTFLLLYHYSQILLSCLLSPSLFPYNSPSVFIFLSLLISFSLERVNRESQRRLDGQEIISVGRIT